MNADKRVEPNYYIDETDGSLKFQDLIADQEARGLPPFKMGHIQSYQGSISGEARPSTTF